MSGAAIQPGASGEKGVTLWEVLKWVAQFVGVVGGAGGGFAVLAFGIGYLATKAHDAMLGLPTAVTEYAAYVRTGALFFPRSIHDMTLVAASPNAWRIALAALVVGTVLCVVLFVSKDVRIVLSKKSLRPGFFGVACAAAVVLAVLYLPYHVAPLDQRNTNLLFQTPGVGDSLSLNAALRRGDDDRLHKRYGMECLAILAFGYVAVGLFQWRRSFSAGTPGWLGVTDWLARPILYATLVAFAITIPTVYGVLALSPAPCVQPSVAAKPDDRQGVMKGPGLLWSDLSADTSQIVILEQTPYGWAQQFYPRRLVRRLETKKCRPLEGPTTGEPTQ